MPEQASLFLTQSSQDTWEDYLRSLRREDFPRWDFVFLTASDENQAQSYRMQLKRRRDQGLLPPGTHFDAVPDPQGKRIGSGGATLGVLEHIAALRGSRSMAGLRILCVHSGGDSRRIPQYSVPGKLFSPVPRELPDGRASTLFDELLITASSMAPRLREGMLLLSGDALLLYNPLQVDHPGRGASAISFKADLALGQNHGVYLPDAQGHVVRFLHKQTPEALRKAGALDPRGMVDIDTGALILSPDVLDSLLAVSPALGEIRLSLYGDFLYPMGEAATLADFLEEPGEEENRTALHRARGILWEALRPHRLRLLRLAPAQFLHFGTTREVLELMTAGVDRFRHLGWTRQSVSSLPAGVSGWCSVAGPDSQAGRGCYLEASHLRGRTRLGDRVFLSCLELRDREIPSDLVLSGLKLRSGRFTVRLWGMGDDPKSGTAFLGIPLETLTGRQEILWDARLFPVCETLSQALDAALNLYALSKGAGDWNAWEESPRTSLAESFRDADPEALMAWQARMEALVRMEQLGKLAQGTGPASLGAGVIRASGLTPLQRQWLAGQPGDRIRLEYYLGKALGGAEGDRHLEESFHRIRLRTLEAMAPPTLLSEARMLRDRCTVRLPLRVNWGGGWSDTPPYCQDLGGTVLNAAISLDGTLPVEATVERLEEKRIRLQSEDMEVLGDFDTLAPLQATGDPYDPFALQKAALVACGVIPGKGGSLEALLDRLGGGFLLRTQVRGVPKGSGLGTSSILCAACAQALLEFFGIPHTPEDTVQRVLAIEQLMGTGGGWQDQIGGLYPGIKLITSRPGLLQKPKVRPLVLSHETKAALNRRFALIYTGQRRLARNLLREVVGRYLGREPEALEALEEIQETAALMAFQLERGRVDAFAGLLSRHWQLSKKLDRGCTNTLIDQILQSVSDLIQGQMICGAGGGGFLQVILREGVTKEELDTRLRQVFHDNPVGVWPCELVWA